MSYFGGASRFAGDPGLFDTLRRLGGRAIRAFTPAPVRAAASLFQRPTSGGFPAIPQLFPTGVSRASPVMQIMADGTMRPRRRKMNMGNVKALKRAMRRQDGFVKIAKKALKGSNFEVVSRAAQATARAKAAVLKAQATRHHAG